MRDCWTRSRIGWCDDNFSQWLCRGYQTGVNQICDLQAACVQHMFTVVLAGRFSAVSFTRLLSHEIGRHPSGRPSLITNSQLPTRSSCPSVDTFWVSQCLSLLPRHCVLASTIVFRGENQNVMLNTPNHHSNINRPQGSLPHGGQNFLIKTSHNSSISNYNQVR